MSQFSLDELNDGPIPLLALRDDEAESEVVLAPSRGALVTRFFDGTRELLYLDQASFLDTSKNVRGGVPVLFPSPGKLENDHWSRGGKGGALKQHGFARNAAWKVVQTDVSSRAQATLSLESGEETRKDYPFDFRVELTWSLRGGTLRAGITVANTGDEPMPYGFGFHPYFLAPLGEKAGARIDTSATRVWDNVEKRERPLGRLYLGGPEQDLHLLDHPATSSALHLPRGTVAVDGSPQFKRWVIWTLPEKEFICLEPWTCPGNALNTGEGLRALAPGMSDSLWVEIRSV